MHLAQHHFQAQSRYFEDSIHFALSHLFFAAHGLAGLELDHEALRNGTVSLLHARGILPDGLAFHIPDGDPAPAPLEIRDRFSPTEDSQLVHLVVPEYRVGGANFSLDGNGASARARYVGETTIVRDEATGRDEKPVIVGRKNFTLVLEQDLAGNAAAIPLARIRRDGSGSFIYDPEYIPPILQIGASSSLMMMLRRLIDVLEAKSAAMTGERLGSGRTVADMAATEIASFWLLHAVHSALAPLRHHEETRRSHPEQLFTELSRLAGALCTFALDADPRALPAYDHAHLDACFGALDRHIRTHLEVIVPTGCVTVPLARTQAYLHAGKIADPRCFGAARWFLGVRSSVGETAVAASVPELVKVCSAKFTPELVRRAYPGLTLTHVPVPPAAISPRVDRQYFAIAAAGPCWDTLRQTGEIGIYVPDALPDVELDLRILVETRA